MQPARLALQGRRRRTNRYDIFIREIRQCNLLINTSCNLIEYSICAIKFELTDISERLNTKTAHTKVKVKRFLWRRWNRLCNSDYSVVTSDINLHFIVWMTRMNNNGKMSLENDSSNLMSAYFNWYLVSLLVSFFLFVYLKSRLLASALAFW